MFGPHSSGGNIPEFSKPPLRGPLRCDALAAVGFPVHSQDQLLHGRTAMSRRLSQKVIISPAPGSQRSASKRTQQEIALPMAPDDVP